MDDINFFSWFFALNFFYYTPPATRTPILIPKTLMPLTVNGTQSKHVPTHIPLNTLKNTHMHRVLIRLDTRGSSNRVLARVI